MEEAPQWRKMAPLSQKIVPQWWKTAPQWNQCGLEIVWKMAVISK